jgi:DNA-binding NtrC family response regulator
MEIQMDLKNEIELAALANVTILLTGPTGAGKSLLAKQIHEKSTRKLKPFVCINLAALHEGTLEAELFGHERGAFTGAGERRVGRLEMAQEGTVFLDEIGEITHRLQARLLEFLQSHVISPLGSNREVKLDVRVIAATNKDLNKAVKMGEFREDLFHRLRVFSIHLKPLVERAEDFDLFLHECLDAVCRIHDKKIYKISEEVANYFESYSWPGNFRELRNVLEYAVIACQGTEIHCSDLPRWFLNILSNYSSRVVLEEEKKGLLGIAEMPLTFNFHENISRFEEIYLRLALQFHRGKIGQTAKGIGMSKATLLRRIRAYRLQI